MEIVDLDELGLDERVRLPSEVILVAQARQLRLGGRGLPQGVRTWRLAFSALCVLRLKAAAMSGRMTMAEVHQRIDLIGRETFTEIESVLQRELRLFEDDDLVRIYGEFVTLHAELRAFAPQSLDTYFPSLCGRHEEIEAMGERDLASGEILDLTRPEGVSLPSVSAPTEAELAATEDEALAKPLPSLRPNSKRYVSLTKWGSSALARGNAVVSAILYRRASRLAPDQARAQEAERLSHEVIDGLVERLQAALAFDPLRADAWRQSLKDLFSHSSRGFWNTNKRLLYDLQKVCVAYERESYTIDVLGFLRSFGRRPLKRALPNQREVLMSKQLRSATGRLAKARITASQRSTVSTLLREAAESAEHQLRRRLRPRIARSLNEKGLRPENSPERVARAKLIEELLDCIVRRGHLNMGDVRDAISRSQLKLSDLTLKELWMGDAILRADRRLNRLLDGVYRRGEFYLRGLQRLSSLGFGRVPGRFMIQYGVVPFGGAFLILEAASIVEEKIGGEGSQSFLARGTEVPETFWDVLRVPVDWRFDSFSNMIPAVIVMGIFLMGLIHSPGFRGFVWAVTQTVFKALKSLVIDVPRWIMGMEWARLFFRTRLAKVLRRYVIAPLIPTAIFYGIAGLLLQLNRVTAVLVFILIFAGLNFFINSSVGRRLEERVGAWAGRLWYRFRVQIIRSLFESVMALFRRFIEITERILYAIDEWLLFKTGENKFTFWLKGIVGGIWSVVSYGIRFCITLLVEPQINPIKHFPVVTVSHKILLPSQPFLANWMGSALSTPMANAVAGAIVTLTPGIAGFLVWELKSNWNLYQANRGATLTPVSVGSHGESLSRLLKPGFHSGVIGKLYARMRRSERQAGTTLRRRQAKAQAQEKLRHVEVSVRQFVEREMFALLKQAPEMSELEFEVSEIRLLPSAIHLRLVVNGAGAWKEMSPLHLLLQAHRDWLVAKIVDPGWLEKLEPEQRSVAAMALAGFYRLSGVELVDEQVRRTLSAPNMLYHLRLSELEVWREGEQGDPIIYGLRTWGTIRPHPASRAKALGFAPVARKQLLLSERDLSWADWVRYWQKDPDASERAEVQVESQRLLPVPVG